FQVPGSARRERMVAAQLKRSRGRPLAAKAAVACGNSTSATRPHGSASTSNAITGAPSEPKVPVSNEASGSQTSANGSQVIAINRAHQKPSASSRQVSFQGGGPV